jgi:hypothetical protein
LLDEPFKTEPPTEDARRTEPPPEAPTTSPELGFYVCPVCHAVNPASCMTCDGFGILDREAMDDFKKKLAKKEKEKKR